MVATPRLARLAQCPATTTFGKQSSRPQKARPLRPLRALSFWKSVKSARSTLFYDVSMVVLEAALEDLSCVANVRVESKDALSNGCNQWVVLRESVGEVELLHAEGNFEEFALYFSHVCSRAEVLAVHQLPFQTWTQEPNTMSVSTLKMRWALVRRPRLCTTSRGWHLINSSTRRVSSCAPPQLGRACPWIRPRTHSRSTLPHPFRTRALKSIATTSNGSQWVQGGSSNRPDVFVGSLFLGTFQLAFDDHWTDHLPFGSSEADIQGALSALPSIREVHVGRSDGAEHGHAWAVTLSPTARRIDGGEAVTNYVVQWNVDDNFREVVANTGSMRVAAQEIDSTAVW